MTHPTRQRPSAVIALLAVVALLFVGCGSDDGDERTGTGDPTTTSTTTEATTDTTEGSSSDPADPSEPGETSAPAETTEPTEGQLSPGDPCSLEEGVPDCIDPDGDGEGVYLIDGAECAATAPDIIACEDLDGDGVAGAPDEYEDLPTCSDDVPPPCNNEPGAHEE